MWRVCSISPTFSNSATKKYSERTLIRKRWGSNCKRDESTDRGIEKWFPGMFPKALGTLEKVCHCLRKLLQRKFCVNRRNVTYFCVVNQLWELFEATYIILLNCKCTMPTASAFHTMNQLINSVALAHERTILTERPPLVGEVSANFCG
jgi:hypothetical protein